MCPEKAILSAFEDGELEGRFRETIKNHIDSCEKCGKAVEKIHTVKQLLHGGEEPSLLRNKEYIKTRVFEFTAIKERRRFWRQGFTLPVPLGLTALALVFFLIGGITFLSLNRNQSPAVADQIQTDAIEIQADELALLRKLLESEGVVIEVNMQIPEQKEIRIIGEPQILTQEQKFNFKND